MRDTGLKAAFLFLFFAPLLLSANTCFVFLFNSNLALEKDTCFYYRDFAEMPIEFFKNGYAAFFFDIESNRRLFFGPAEHNHSKQTFVFNLRGALEEPNENLSFWEYSISDFSKEKSLEEMRFIAETFSLNELRAVIDCYKKEFQSSYIFTETFRLFSLYIAFEKAQEKREFQKKMNLSLELFKAFPEDESALKIYIYSLMDMADFYTANSNLDKFYEKREKNEDYYSLKANLFAIWGNFDLATGFIEKGRFLFPESMKLLTDAINIYSVTDTVKMLELIEYHKTKIQN